MPIGTEEVIKTAPRERFVEFYDKWYTPNRMALIIVGDIEVDGIEGLVDTYFKDLPARDKAPDPKFGGISKRKFATHYHYEEEAGESSVSIETFQRRVDPPDNKERRAHDLRLMLASQMINRRLGRIAKKDDSPIAAARAHAGDFYDMNFALYGSIEADCTAENWEPAMAVIDQELRRALEHGFSEAELNEVVANIENSYENAAKSVATRQSRNLADGIASRIGSRRIYTNPAEDLPRVKAELANVTTDQCLTHLRELWDGKNEILLLASGNLKIDNAEVALKAAYDASREIAVAPPEQKEVKAFAYGDLPEAGKIAETKTIEDLEVTQLRFENNVRVNMKVTDFEDERIYIKARFGGGTLTEPKDKPGLAFFTGSTFNSAGLEEHSLDDLKQLFAGKSVSVSFGIDDDAFSLGGATTPEDLADELLLMRAYLTNPGYREVAATEFRKGLDYIYQQLDQTPQGFAQKEVTAFLHGGDQRFGYPDRDVVEKRTLAEAKAWLQDDFTKGYLEISVVGDFDPEKTTALLAKTFGSLPERAAKKPDYTAERVIKFPKKETDKAYEIETTIPKATVAVYWPTADIFDIEKTRRIGMVGSIMDDRLRVKVREELGDAYSPFAHNIPSDTFKDYGYLFANVTVDPSQTESVGAVVRDIAAELATGESITQDELDRAKKPNVVQIEEMRRTNRYWIGSVLEASQEYPQRLDWSRTFVEDYKSITLEEVNAIAKEYLSAHKGLVISVKPKAE